MVYNSAAVTTDTQFMVNIVFHISRCSVQAFYTSLVTEISELRLIFHDSEALPWLTTQGCYWDNSSPVTLGNQ